MSETNFPCDPEKAARLLTTSEPHRAYASPAALEEHGIGMLCEAITERLKERIGPTNNCRTQGIRLGSGGPGGIRTLDQQVSSLRLMSFDLFASVALA